MQQQHTKEKLVLEALYLIIALDLVSLVSPAMFAEEWLDGLLDGKIRS